MLKFITVSNLCEKMVERIKIKQEKDKLNLNDKDINIVKRSKDRLEAFDEAIDIIRLICKDVNEN